MPDNSTLNLPAYQVIVFIAGNFGLEKTAGGSGEIADYADGIDIGRLAEKPAFGGTAFAGTINQTGKLSADYFFIFLKHDFLLGQHKLLKSLLLNVVGDLIREFSSGSSIFRVKGEAAEIVEAGPVDEIEQLVKTGVGFAGEADNEGGSQDAVG